MGVERNYCIESGCPAACCRNIHGQVAGSVESFRKAFPDAIPLNSESELIDKVKNQETGVYYFSERGWVYFSVSGDCPNLTNKFDCRIHGQRFYPRFCINMVMGSQGCEQSKELYTINQVVLG